MVVAVGGCTNDKRVSVAGIRSDLYYISSALRIYRLDCGSFPHEKMGLNVLVDATGDNCHSRLPFYISDVPRDPRGRPYRYRLIRDDQFEVSWLGADGKPGGDGEDADVTRIETWAHQLRTPSPADNSLRATDRQ